MAAHPVAPDLVSNFPKLHRKWSRVPVRGTHRAILRSRRTITVFNPGCSLVDSCATSFNVHRDRWFSTRGARKSDELISAEVAWLRFVLPRQIGPRDAFITRTDTP